MIAIHNGITAKEWRETITIEYVLSQGYSKSDADIKRLNKLREKRFVNGFGFDVNEYYRILCDRSLSFEESYQMAHDLPNKPKTDNNDSNAGIN